MFYDPIEKETCDIAIVGGGMVGLTLALLLERELPEKSIWVLESETVAKNNKTELTQASFDSRSTALSASTIDILQAIGLWGGLAQKACEISEVLVSDSGHLGATSFSREQNKDCVLGYVTENAALGRQLNTAVLSAKNIRLVDGANVRRLSPIAGGSRILIERNGNNSSENSCDNIQLTAQLTVIADGVHSPLREQLGIAVERASYQQHAIVTNVEMQLPHKGKAYERFTQNGPLALLPIGENTCSNKSALVWTCPEAKIAERMSLDDRAFLSLLQKSFGFRQGEFIRVGKRVNYPLELVVAKEQIRSGIVLMGNAAHFLHPVAGQGFNLALRDCAKLCESLHIAVNSGESLGSLDILQHYIASQKSDQWLTTYISHSFHQLFGDKPLPIQAGRNLGLLVMELIPEIKKTFFDQMMGRGFPRAALNSFQ